MIPDPLKADLERVKAACREDNSPVARALLVSIEKWEVLYEALQGCAYPKLEKHTFIALQSIVDNFNTKEA